MKTRTILSLVGLGLAALAITLVLGRFSDTRIAEVKGDRKPFPQTLSQREFPLGVPEGIAHREILMDEQGRYPEYIVDTFKNGDKGKLKLRPGGGIAEITIEYFATALRVWFAISRDGATIMEKRLVDMKTNALIESGQRQSDQFFMLEEYFPGTKNVKRVRVYEPRAMTLSGGLAGVNLVRKDRIFWPNLNLRSDFTAADPITSDLYTYTEAGLPESYLNVNYRYRKGWFFYPDGITIRMHFERKKVERNYTGFWEVHTDYFSPAGSLEAKRIFTRDAMLVHVDLPRFGPVEQIWSMIDTAKPEDKRLLADNFTLAVVNLPSYAGKQNFRFVFQQNGSILKEVWFEETLASGIKVKAFLTLDAYGKVVSERVLDVAKDKQIEKQLYKGAGPFVAPPQLKVLFDYIPPPVAALEPDYDWGH